MKPDNNESNVPTFPDRLIDDVATMLFGSLAYIGDHLGLYEHLVEQGPVSAETLAERSACDPRYVREWLSAMVAAGWVAYDPETGQFWLPPEHVPVLVQESHPSYLGGMLQAAGVLAQMVPDVMHCVRHGGGITYRDHHPDMPAVIDRLSAPYVDAFLTKVWLPELLPDVHAALTAGTTVADIGCGTGRALAALAKAYPNSRFTGYEPNERSARWARAALVREGLDGQVTVVQAGSEAMVGNRYDFVTLLNVVHESVDPQGIIGDVYDALMPGGTCLIQEMAADDHLEAMRNPVGRLLYSLSTLYSLSVSLAHGGAGLGVCAGEALLCEMCTYAGFARFRRLDFAHPLVVLYEVNK